MYKYFVLFYLIHFSFIVFSQKIEEKTIENWLKDNNYLDNHNYLNETSIPKSISKVSDSEIESIKHKEKDLIKKNLLKKIYNSELPKELYLVDFGNHETYFIETDKKYIKIVCVINKEDISDYWIKDIERKLDNLKSSLSESQITRELTSIKIQEMLSRTVNARKEIELYELIAFKLNPKINWENINLVKNDIDGRINDLNSRMDKTILINKLNNALDKKSKQDYLGAYMAYKQLKLEYPGNTDVLEGLNETFGALIKTYDLKMEVFEDEGNYNEAIKMIESIIKLDIELLNKYSSKLEELRKKKFIITSENIEKLLSYKTVSGEQLKNNLNELKEIRNIDINRYHKIKADADKRLLDYDIKLVKSDVYNKNHKEALSKIPLLKINYERSRSIEVLEKQVDRKIYRHFKKELLQKRPRLYGLEPAIMLVSSPQSIDNINSLSMNNLNMNYSFGIYRRISIKPKNKEGRYKFSSIGLKLDYLDADITYNQNDSSLSLRNNTFINPQISFGLRKCIYLDFGLVKFEDKMLPNLYNGTFSFFIPFRYFSLGVSAKYLTDFKTKNTIITGAGLKINLGFHKNYNSRDKDEIQTSILKLKQ
jgi:hypothetical protein